MSLGLKYKNNQQIFQEVTDSTPYLEYPLLKSTGIVKHGFSTRLGGVSKGYYELLNLGMKSGDDKTLVQENFRRIGAAMEVNIEDMVFSAQTHTDNLHVVTESNRGMGITRPLEYQDVDGLVTNYAGICLVTFYADCVPLFFVDPVKKAIGLSHSGWRGTVAKIGKRTLQLMQEQFDSNPRDILATIGPSICVDCYEVSEEVIEQFRQHFAKKHWEALFVHKSNGKYQLDLWKANELIFREAGIQAEHMAISNLCTFCNSGILYSHRRSGNKRGNLAAFLALK